MKRVPLGKHLYALVDDVDFWTVAEQRWTALAAGFSGTQRPRWIAVRIDPVSGKSISLHRLIANAAEGQEVDHVDGDTLNNQRANLRLCDRSENNFNIPARKNNACGIKGVYFSKNSKNGAWVAEISARGKRYKLGRFLTKEEAGAAYSKAAAELHGTFQRTEPYPIDARL